MPEISQSKLGALILDGTAARLGKAALAISLKPSLVEQVDAAAELGIDRSGVIAPAAREYVKRLEVY
jgi:hypothetical protein